MAYADHAFSIFDEDIMMDSDSVYTTHNRTPVKKDRSHRLTSRRHRHRFQHNHGS
ncbi:hypothetical protein Hanom_Chr15g01378021 [Helianthus anomalus]